MCNDRCPECDCETVPTASTDLSRPLTKEDFEGAAKLFHERYPDPIFEVSPEEAREYAEAMREGGEYRFREKELNVFPKVIITPFLRSFPS
jgi:hypothetical protein